MVPIALTEIEGTWEEILEHASELRGCRVRLTVLDDDNGAAKQSRLRPENREMLALLDEWRRTPLPDEERRALDEFEQFRREHPFRLRRLDLQDEQQ